MSCGAHGHAKKHGARTLSDRTTCAHYWNRRNGRWKMAAWQWAVSRSVRHQWGTREIETVCVCVRACVCVCERERESRKRGGRTRPAQAMAAVGVQRRQRARGCQWRGVQSDRSAIAIAVGERGAYRFSRRAEQRAIARRTHTHTRSRRRAGSRRDARGERRVEAAASRSSRVECAARASAACSVDRLRAVCYERRRVHVGFI